MDYYHNFAQIGPYGLPLMFPQLYYPEINGGQGYVTRNSHYHDDYNYGKDRNEYNRYSNCTNNYSAGGDFLRDQKAAPVDLNNFYDGDDFKHHVHSEHSTCQSGTQGHPYPCNSSSGYRSYARRNREERELFARNGLCVPRDSHNKQQQYHSPADDYRTGDGLYWH